MPDKEKNQLDEVKATGENSSTADPVTPAGGSPKGKNRRADKNASAYPVEPVENEANEKIPGGEPFDKTSPAERKGTGKKAPARRADKAAVKESVDEMFEGQDLSEDFKEKASVIFEAALNTKLDEETQRLEEEFEEKLEEEVESAVEEIIEQVDTYLDMIVDTWLEENQLAVDNGLKVEMAESLMQNLRDVFVEHNLNVPEESEDILDEMVEEIDYLKEKLNNVMNENIELNSLLEEAAIEDAIDEISEGLTMSQVEKLKKLAEKVDFESIDELKEKVSILKENYFGASGKVLKETFGDDTDPVDNEENSVVHSDPAVARYAAAISKTLKK